MNSFDPSAAGRTRRDESAGPGFLPTLTGAGAPTRRITPLDVQLAWAANDCVERPSMNDLLQQSRLAKDEGDHDRARLYLACARRRLDAIHARAREDLYGDLT